MGNEFIKNIKYVLDSIVEVIYPRENICPICNSYVDENEMLCGNCKGKIKFCREAFKIKKLENEFIFYSMAYYSNVIMELVVRLKYKSDFISAEILAGFMAEYVANKKVSFDVITFVPLSTKSLKLRGYNQSEILAREVSKYTGKSVISCLEKIKETKDQIGLDEKNRWKNLSGCFIPNMKASNEYKDKIVLLIDDVVTTGATAFYCAEGLKKSGAKDVFILTAAKSRI